MPAKFVDVDRDQRFVRQSTRAMEGEPAANRNCDLIKANGQEFNPDLPHEKYVNGFDQWNRARVVVEGNKVQHFLNGIKVVEYERNTQMWHALVAYSKYAKWPNFGDYESGNILLQDHGDDVRFRNIKIKVLN
jgi:hypothetical protein